MASTNCLNCNNPLEPQEKFCSNCSQKAETHRLTLHDISHDAIHAITHADKGFLFLVKELATNPGRVAQEYIEGKRKKYFNPFSFLVIVTGILVLVSSNFQIFGNAMKKPGTTANYQKPSSKTDAAKEGFKRRSVAFGDFINNHSNILPFISTPFLSFFFWIFYKKKKLFYAEHLTSMAFFNGFIMIVTSLVFGPIIYFTRHLEMYTIWLPLMLLFHIIYFSIAYKQLFNYAGIKGFFITFSRSLLATFFWMLFSTAIGTLYIIFGK